MFSHFLGELLEQTGLSEDVFGRVAAFEQLIDEVV